jgi:hypothetical protein
VIGSAAAVALQRHREHPDGGQHRDEGEHCHVAHREAEHRHRRGDEGRGQPGLPEFGAGEEVGERVTELVVEGDRLAERGQERVEPGERGRYRPDPRRSGSDVEGAGELRLG